MFSRYRRGLASALRSLTGANHVTRASRPRQRCAVPDRPEGGGGYILAQPSANGTVVSIGIEDDNSADLSFADRGWQVVEWDPTVSCLPVTNPAITFHARGLGPSSMDGLDNLPNIIEASHVQGPAILMVDIDSDEYLRGIEMQAQHLSRFDQIVIELDDLHRVLEPEHRSRVEALLDELLARHEVIHARE